MPAPIRTERVTWIDAGLRALASGGPDAVRIEPLAAELGVTRGGFYWHFADRQGFLDAMLDTWEHRSTAEAVQRAERAGADARTRVRRAGLETFSKDLLPIDLAVRDWARRDKAVAKRLRRVDNQRIAYLRAQISTFCADADEVEARSMLAFSLAIGRHFIAATHDGRRRADVLEHALDRILA